MELHKDFHEHVIQKLPALSQDAAINKKDPEGMTEENKRRIRRDIKEAVYGKYLLLT